QRHTISFSSTPSSSSSSSGSESSKFSLSQFVLFPFTRSAAKTPEISISEPDISSFRRGVDAGEIMKDHDSRAMYERNLHALEETLSRKRLATGTTRTLSQPLSGGPPPPPPSSLPPNPVRPLSSATNASKITTS